MTPSTIIFDLDGTLLNTLDDLHANWLIILAKDVLKDTIFLFIMPQPRRADRTILL